MTGYTALLHPYDTTPAILVSLSSNRAYESLLAWYFVSVWGSGFIATKIGLQHAAPFTFLALRFAFGLCCLIPIMLIMRPRLPATRAELGHVVVAGLLMHAVHLGGSHYTQYLGMSAGITALLLSARALDGRNPDATAMAGHHGRAGGRGAGGMAQGGYTRSHRR
jgi:hypothetical protein